MAKITRAQELIASSRIVKAQQRMQAAVPYAREITRAVTALVSNTGSIDHPLPVAKEQRHQGRRPDRHQRPRFLRRLQRQRPP